jgi:hypothetical protein
MVANKTVELVVNKKERVSSFLNRAHLKKPLPFNEEETIFEVSRVPIAGIKQKQK